MTDDELEKLKSALLASKRVRTEAGEIEERSVSEIEDALRILQSLEMMKNKKSAISRIGRYSRRFD